MLEQLVRPFQSPFAVAQRRITVISVETSSLPDARLTWGTVGTLPAGAIEDDDKNLLVDGFKLETCDNTLAETSRRTKQIRVENPDDPSQFVIIQVPTSVSFTNGERKSIVGAIASETTAFSDISIKGSTTGWDTVTRRNDCRTEMDLNN